MGQIHGQDLGAPAAIVTSGAELLVTGSVSPTTEARDNQVVLQRETNSLLNSILKQVSMINLHLESMTGLTLEKENV